MADWSGKLDLSVENKEGYKSPEIRGNVSVPLTRNTDFSVGARYQEIDRHLKPDWGVKAGFKVNF